jgi:hypothetical protein
MLRLGLICALAVTVLLPAVPAAAQAGCAFHGGFAQLQALIPDHVGSCTADEQYRPDQGLSTQQTSTGTLLWHSVDGALSFSDGFHAWVLDPTGQVQVRGVAERFGFEFNGDGFPLAGQPATWSSSWVASASTSPSSCLTLTPTRTPSSQLLAMCAPSRAPRWS